VRIYVRRRPPAEFMNDANVEVFLGDLGDPVAVDRAVAGTEIVYHVGAAMTGGAHDHERGTVCGTQNIVDSVLRQRKARLVYVSSLSCLHAASAGRGAVVTEDWPIEPSPARRGSYTQAKTQAEQIVRDAVRDRNLQAVVLRPGRVLDPQITQLTPDVAHRLKNFIVVLGRGNRQLPLVHVEDVVSAILLAANKSAFDGRVYHLVDRAPITQNQIVVGYMKKYASDAKVVHVPVTALYGLAVGFELLSKVLKRSAPLSIYRLKSAFANMQFDCGRAEKELGWTPRNSHSAGLQQAMTTAGPADAATGIVERVQES